MSAEPVGSVQPKTVTDPCEVVHLGGQAAVIVPLAEFLRLRALKCIASREALGDAEDAAPQPRTGSTAKPGARRTTPHSPEVRRRLGIAD